MECRVEFDYVAQEPDELTIKKGEIIKDVIPKMDGWYQGTLRGKSGVFPDNFVKFVEQSNPAPEPAPEKIAKPSGLVILRNNPNSARRVKVLFSYTPEQDDELSLEVGDVLDFIEEVEEGWWRGHLKGKEGIFPSNFVSDVEEPKPKSNGSIDFSKDDSANQKDFRSNHTKGIPDVVPASSPIQNTEDEPVPPELPPKPVREIARCFYPYKALNEDELTLSEGDIITIISRSCEDEGWWRGELRGKVGLFPDNFVKLINPGDTHPTVGGQQPKLHAQERNSTPSTPATASSVELPAAKAKKDSIVGNSVTVIDGSGMSKSLERDKSVDSKVEVAKAKLSKSNSKEAQVQVPKVGHVATSPISPGIAAFHNNLFSNQKPDTVVRKDSQAIPPSEDTEEFNSVERTETLNHLTATRAKAPKRRPPSTIITRDIDVSMMNGSSHSYENSVTDSPPPHHRTPVNLSITSNGTPSGSYADGSSLNHSGNYTSQNRDKEGSPTPSSANSSSASTTKPKKQALPWMAELKQTQDKKRGVVSPGLPPTTNTTTSSASPSVPAIPQPVNIPPVSQQSVPALPKEPAPRAPSLPPKPSTLSTVSSDKPATNSNPATVNNSMYSVSNKNAPKKSPSPAPPTLMTNHSNSVTTTTTTDINRGDGDSNKSQVSYEEHLALKTRVTSLENEVETLKRQIKLLLDRDLRGHIV